MPESNNTPEWPNAEQRSDLKTKIRLAAELAFSAVGPSTDKLDVKHGAWGPLTSVVNKIDLIDGHLAQTAIGIILEECPHFDVLAPGIKLPLTQTAEKLINSNKQETLDAVRVKADDRPLGFYTPDHLVIDQRSGELFIIEDKRKTQSYGKGALVVLKDKMLNASLTAVHELMNIHHVVGIRAVQTIIVDCADSDHRQQKVVRVSDLDAKLSLNVFADVMSDLSASVAEIIEARLSTVFQEHVHATLDINKSEPKVAFQNAEGGNAPPIPLPNVIVKLA